jgi:hypothetical protein
VTFFSFLNHWWNLPFLVMLGLVAVFFVLQLVGLVGHHGDHDVDHHVDHDHDHDHDADTAGTSSLLAFFGIGRVPFMVVWVSLFLVGGFVGLFVNRFFYLENDTRYPGWAFGVATALSLVLGLAATALAARLAGKLVDTGGRGATSKAELAGKLGTVAAPASRRSRAAPASCWWILIPTSTCSGRPCPRPTCRPAPDRFLSERERAT